MTDLEHELREMMHQEVGLVERRPIDTHRLAQRARRRRTASATLGAAAVLVFVVGTAFASRAVFDTRADLDPARPDPVPVVSAENGDIAFTRSEGVDASSGPLYVMHPTGGRPRLLDACPGTCEKMAVRGADWSPDGTRIAYTVTATTAESIGNRAGIYVLDVVTGESTQLTECVSPCSLQEGLDWSPDGTRIVFDEAANGHCSFAWGFAGSCAIYTMNADGSDRTQIPTGSLTDPVLPSWSPDGTHLAFSAREEQDWFVHTMALDGSDLRQLSTGLPSGNPGRPGWAPTGEQIAFIAVAFGADSHPCEVWTVAPDGSDRANVYQGCEPGGAHISFGGTGPEWSPDGTRMAFYDGDGIALIDPDGSNPTKLEPTGGRPTGVVAWQPLP
jgi:Tol biopolymer transport system component